MRGENVVDIELIESENFTYVYPYTLEMLFPGEAEIVRERPTMPLRERDENEIARLRSHPLFLED